MNTIEMVRKAQRGDQESLVLLIMVQKAEYYKLAYVYMRNQHDALDAMEDMILLLYDNIHQLKKEEAFYSWSKTILVNCCKKALKKRKKIIPIHEMQEESIEAQYDQKETELDVQKELQKLNEKHQEVLKLRYYMDMDYLSISKLLKIPVGTVKSRISIGLKKLKENIGGEWI